MTASCAGEHTSKADKNALKSKIPAMSAYHVKHPFPNTLVGRVSSPEKMTNIIKVSEPREKSKLGANYRGKTFLVSRRSIMAGEGLIKHRRAENSEEGL